MQNTTQWEKRFDEQFVDVRFQNRLPMSSEIKQFISQELTHIAEEAKKQERERIVSLIESYKPVISEKTEAYYCNGKVLTAVRAEAKAVGMAIFWILNDLTPPTKERNK